MLTSCTNTSCPYLSSEILPTCFYIHKQQYVGVSHSKELQIKWKISKIWSGTLFLDHLLTQRNIIDTCSVGYSCVLCKEIMPIYCYWKNAKSSLLQRRTGQWQTEIQIFGYWKFYEVFSIIFFVSIYLVLLQFLCIHSR